MATVPAEIIYDLLNDNWDQGNVRKPKIVQRETAEKLREELPRTGLILIYAESGGIRVSPRGNRMYKDELVNVTVEVWTLTSHEALYKLQEEVMRIVELKTRDVLPFHIIRLLNYSEEYGRTFRAWKGDVRLELSRVATRTAYAGPGS